MANAFDRKVKLQTVDDGVFYGHYRARFTIPDRDYDEELLRVWVYDHDVELAEFKTANEFTVVGGLEDIHEFCKDKLHFDMC